MYMHKLSDYQIILINQVLIFVHEYEIHIINEYDT